MSDRKLCTIRMGLTVIRTRTYIHLKWAYLGTMLGRDAPTVLARTIVLMPQQEGAWKAEAGAAKAVMSATTASNMLLVDMMAGMFRTTASKHDTCVHTIGQTLSAGWTCTG